MNLISAAGKIRLANVLSPKWIDLTPGYEYVVVFANQTAGALAGSFTFESAQPSAGNPCLPDAATWTAIPTFPECDDLPSVVAGTAAINFASAPIAPYTQCHVAIKCPGPFLRVVGTTTLDVLGYVGRLKRTQ